MVECGKFEYWSININMTHKKEQRMKKMLICILSFVLGLCAFSDEPNFAKFKELVSGVWSNEINDPNSSYVKKVIFFPVFYEYSPNIIAFKAFVESVTDINTSLESVWEKDFDGYDLPKVSMETFYLYDEILDVYYSWNGYQKYQLSIIFEPKTEELYSLQLTKENIERLKFIRKDGRGLNELSDYADSIIGFDGNKAKVVLNEDLASRKRRANFIFYTLISPQKPLEKIASSFDVKTYMNVRADLMIPDKMKDLQKRLISYFGECTLEFSGRRELRVYLNLGEEVSMTYYDKNTKGDLSNMNRGAIDLLAPNGIPENQKRIKYYYCVPFTKLRLLNLIDGGGFLVFYISEEWVKDSPESDFRKEERMYVGKEDEEGNFVFYSGKEPYKKIEDFCITNEYRQMVSMKKGLEPKFKMKFGGDEIIMWILKDGKWRQNFRMSRSPSGM